MKGNKSILHRLLVILLISTLFIATVYAGNEDQDKLNSVNNQIDVITGKIVKNKREVVTANTELERLIGRIAALEGDIKKLNGEIEVTKDKIEVTTGKLVVAEDNVRKKNDILNKRLRVMYMNGTVGYLEVVLDSASIEDMLGRIDMIKRIYKHDVDLLKYLKEQRDYIKQEKKNLEAQKGELQTLVSNTRVKKDHLNVSRGNVERLKADLLKNRKLLDKEENNLNELAKKIEVMIERKQTAAKYVGGEMMWPAPGRYTITSPFGNRIHPILKTKKLHTGIDIRSSMGESVLAAQDGKVMHANWLGGYGRVVMIDHGGGIVTLYAHNSKLTVESGDKVKKGQVIAKSGNSGVSTGPHIHFEVRKNKKYVNPMDYVKKK